MLGFFVGQNSQHSACKRYFPLEPNRLKKLSAKIEKSFMSRTFKSVPKMLLRLTPPSSLISVFNECTSSAKVELFELKTKREFMLI